MNVVGKVGSLISQGVYSVATPFHPFGGAVDVIVVQQQDGTFRSTPWYVQFGKFQGVLKGVEKIVRISVNGVEADFHMYLDNSGEAYFVKEVNSGECSDVKGDLKEGDGLEGAKKEVTNDEKGNLGGLERTASDSGRLYYEFEDDQLSLENSIELSEFESSRYDNLDVEDQYVESNNLNSEVVLISVDGHILKAPISSMERDIDDDVELSTPKFHLGPGQEADFFEDTADFTPSDDAWTTNYLNVLATSPVVESKESCCAKTAVEASEIEDCAGNKEHPSQVEERESGAETNLEDGSINEDILATSPVVESKESCCEKTAVEASKPQPEDCAGNEEHNSQIEERESGAETNPEDGSINIRKEDVFKSCLDIPALANHDRDSPLEIIENASLGPANEGGGDADNSLLGHNDDLALSSSSLPLNKQAELDTTELIGENVVTGDINSDNTSPPKATDNTEVEKNVDDSLAVEQCSMQRPEDISELPSTPSGRRWRLWPIPFRRVKVLEHTSSTSTIDEGFVDSLSGSQNQLVETTPTSTSGNENKQFLRINVPTTEQIASLNLKEGQNIVTFSFCTRVLGMQQVDAHIYLWKWNARIVISDVDGTITKSDVLGQFMPLFGRDWTQSGVARLFCAIKENGYQLLFLSARAIVQAYITRSFLNNIKQDGKALPTGPVVISPNGLFPSLYREVIRRAPQEFKIACLEDIKALFPPDYNPFYAGFGNRDTDELSYRKIGIPKGKIFIINPKGEVAISQHRIDVKSYTSLHTLVNDMFPPTSMVEQEDFNSWNFWRMPLPDLD